MNNVPRLLLVPGLVALLAEPCVWLAHTWADPAYDSDGAAVAALCALLVARSVASGPAPSGSAWGVLLLAAGLRLVARWLDVSHLGALTLALDVWGVGRLLALDPPPVARLAGGPWRVVRDVVADRARPATGRRAPAAPRVGVGR